MEHEDTLAILKSRSEKMAERFNIASLAVFGLAARQESHRESDVDVIVTSQGAATFE